MILRILELKVWELIDLMGYNGTDLFIEMQWKHLKIRYVEVGKLMCVCCCIGDFTYHTKMKLSALDGLWIVVHLNGVTVTPQQDC